MTFTQHQSYQILILKLIREFFTENNFDEVMTPPIVQNPGSEVHIHPFEVMSKINHKKLNLYLHTSPEFQMKKILAHGFKNIYNIAYSFRDEPQSDIHRHQFIMLEWYRSGKFYDHLMQDCFELITKITKSFALKKILNPQLVNTKMPFVKKTIDEIFMEILNIKISDYLDSAKIKALITHQFPDLPCANQDEFTWEDCFFLIFLNKIEPELKKYPFIILYEYPAPLAALATLKDENPKVCNRFELYLHGIEIANCFHELTDLSLQKKRFSHQAKLKEELYHYQLPVAENFYKTLEKGLPYSSGIALGVERLIYCLSDAKQAFWD